MNISEQDLGKWVETNSSDKEHGYGILINLDTVYFPFADNEIKDITEITITRVLEHVRYGFIMDEFHQ